MQRTAILIVNGFDRRNRWGKFEPQEAIDFSWIDLCLRQIARHSRGSNYEVHVFDNARLIEHKRLLSRHPNVIVHPNSCIKKFRLSLSRFPHFLINLIRQIANSRSFRHLPPSWELPHPVALDWLVKHLGPEVEFFITLDNDSFPIRDGWIEELIGNLIQGATLSGVLRNEMKTEIEPFIHVSGLCIRTKDFRALPVSFSKSMAKDVGQNITLEVAKRKNKIVPLNRSNAKNFHFLMGGIYGGMIYHHGAGGRHPRFWTSDTAHIRTDQEIKEMLRNRAFENLERLIEDLSGRRYGT